MSEPVPEMIERAARALCRQQCERNAQYGEIEALGIERAVDYSWPVWVEQARTVIEAMREPTRYMLDRGAYHCITGAGAATTGDMAQAQAVWKAMIQKALED